MQPRDEPMLSSAALRDRVTLACIAMEQKSDVDRNSGRVGEAERWDVFRNAVEEYIKLLENTVRAARETIRALDNSTRIRAEKATDGDERILGLR